MAGRTCGLPIVQACHLMSPVSVTGRGWQPPAPAAGHERDGFAGSRAPLKDAPPGHARPRASTASHKTHRRWCSAMPSSSGSEVFGSSGFSCLDGRGSRPVPAPFVPEICGMGLTRRPDAATFGAPNQGKAAGSQTCKIKGFFRYWRSGGHNNGSTTARSGTIRPQSQPDGRDQPPVIGLLGMSRAPVGIEPLGIAIGAVADPERLLHARRT